MEPFWEPILGPDRPKRDQDGPKRAIKSFKVSKICICENPQTHNVFQCFWGPRMPKIASEIPRRLPRGSRRAPKPEKKRNPKMNQHFTHLWTNFGTIFGFVLGPNFAAQKGDQKWDLFWKQFWSHLGLVWGCLGGHLEVRVRTGSQQCSGPGPGRGKGRATKLIYSAYLAYLAA